MIDEMPVETATRNLQGVGNRQHPHRIETAFGHHVIGRIEPIVAIQARRLEFAGVSGRTVHRSDRIEVQGQQKTKNNRQGNDKQ